MRHIRFLPPILLLLIAVTPFPARAEVIEEIMVRVNNNVITRADFAKRRATTLAALNQQYSGDELIARAKTVDADVLRRMTEEYLLIERAKQLYDLEKLVDYQQDNFMQTGGIKSKADLEAKLKSEGMSLAQFREEILHFAVPDFVRSREIRAQLTIPRAEAEKYYQAHPDEFTGTGRRRAAQLMFDAAKHPDAAEQQARIEMALKDGDFGKAASQFSDAANAADGGDLGFVKKGELRAELDGPLFAAEKEHLVLGPITATGKLYWLLVLKIEGEGLQPFDAVRSEIERKLQDERYPAASEKYIADLWARNYVVVAPAYRDAITPKGAVLTEPVRAPAPALSRRERRKARKAAKRAAAAGE